MPPTTDDNIPRRLVQLKREVDGILKVATTFAASEYTLPVPLDLLAHLLDCHARALRAERRAGELEAEVAALHHQIAQGEKEDTP